MKPEGPRAMAGAHGRRPVWSIDMKAKQAWCATTQRPHSIVSTHLAAGQVPVGVTPAAASTRCSPAPSCTPFPAQPSFPPQAPPWPPELPAAPAARPCPWTWPCPASCLCYCPPSLLLLLLLRGRPCWCWRPRPRCLGLAWPLALPAKAGERLQAVPHLGGRGTPEQASAGPGCDRAPCPGPSAPTACRTAAPGLQAKEHVRTGTLVSAMNAQCAWCPAVAGQARAEQQRGAATTVVLEHTSALHRCRQVQCMQSEQQHGHPPCVGQRSSEAWALAKKRTCR